MVNVFVGLRAVGGLEFSSIPLEFLAASIVGVSAIENPSEQAAGRHKDEWAANRAPHFEVSHANT